MLIDTFRRTLLFGILCLVQALVFNHIHLFDCATPLLYVYFVLLFPRNFPKWAILVWSFIMGLVIDTFSNTPGVAAASMTFLGLIQPYLMIPFTPRDSPDDLVPSMKTLGLTKFIYFAVIAVFIYCLLFFTLEAFNFFNWLQWLENILASTVLTSVLILVIENVRRK
jgi:rod shape-determining protein MreD